MIRPGCCAQAWHVRDCSAILAEVYAHVQIISQDHVERKRKLMFHSGIDQVPEELLVYMVQEDNHCRDHHTMPLTTSVVCVAPVRLQNQYDVQQRGSRTGMALAIVAQIGSGFRIV